MEKCDRALLASVDAIFALQLCVLVFYKKDLFKGKESLLKIYCKACHTRFSFFFPAVLLRKFTNIKKLAEATGEAPVDKFAITSNNNL